MERKLAAIFSTDVKGYSRLMGDDEEATIHPLKTYREVISSLIEQHHGRVVDSPGDNMAQREGPYNEPPNLLKIRPCLAYVQEVHLLHAMLKALEVPLEAAHPVQKLQQKTKGKKQRAFLGFCTP